MKNFNIERAVTAYSKIPNQNGEYPLKGEFQLKPIELSLLKEIFELDDDDVDTEMYSPYEIKENHVSAIQPYVIGGTIDLNEYFYYLECYQI